jgi:GAF domain-containing protein
MTDPTSRQIREAEQKIRILYEITRFVSSLLHLQHVLDAIVDLLMEEFRLDVCSIRLLDRNGKLRIKSYKGLSEAYVEKAARTSTVDSYIGDCFLTGRIVIVNDTEKVDNRVSTNLMVGKDIKSFAVTPIKIEGDTIGVLVTASKKKQYFHERFNDVIYIIANQIGIAIRISQLYEEIYNFNKELEEKVKERTDDLEEKTQQLVAAERLAALGKMSNMVAHELRNSLTVVGGFARRLHENITDDGPDKKYAKIIVDEVGTLEDRVSRIIKMGEEEQTTE